MLPLLRLFRRWRLCRFCGQRLQRPERPKLYFMVICLQWRLKRFDVDKLGWWKHRYQVTDAALELVESICI